MRRMRQCRLVGLCSVVFTPTLDLSPPGSVSRGQVLRLVGTQGSCLRSGQQDIWLCLPEVSSDSQLRHYQMCPLSGGGGMAATLRPTGPTGSEEHFSAPASPRFNWVGDSQGWTQEGPGMEGGRGVFQAKPGLMLPFPALTPLGLAPGRN